MKKSLLLLGALAMSLTFTLSSCGDDDNKGGSGSGNGGNTKIPVSEAYNVEYKADYATAWGNYMRIVSKLLKDDATTLYNDWAVSYEGGDSYAKQFKAHNGSLEGLESADNCLSQIIDGCIDIASEVGETKIGDPINKWNAGNKNNEALYAVESWYSWHSRDDYTHNIYSIRNAYYGNIYKEDAKNYDVVAANSIYNIIKDYDADLNDKVVKAIKDAADAIQAIPQPFRNNIGSAEAKAAQQACGELAAILEEEVKPIFENNKISDDTKLDAVIAQYVDVVVVPTYKELLDKNTALDTAVNNFVKNPSNAGFEACATAWLNARLPWESSEAFLFGPVADKGLDPNMDSWPLDQIGIVNILNSQDFAELEWNGEYDEESEDIEDAQSLRGFHTLEFLIFKDGKARTIH